MNAGKTVRNAIYATPYLLGKISHLKHKCD